MTLGEAELDTIRTLYNKVLKLEEMGLAALSKAPAGKQIMPTEKIYSQEKFTVVFDRITNIEWFKMSYELLKKNVENELKIYVLKTDVSLSDFYSDITVFNFDSITELLEYRLC
jgi:hypothetical protein